MKRLFATTETLSRYMYWISGVALACVMLLTVTDVILRVFDRPITGVYDLTVQLGGVIIGFAVPLSTRNRAHVYMGFFIEGVSPRWKRVLWPIAHSLGIFLFILLGWNLMGYGTRLFQGGEVSPTIHLPFYPVVMGVGAACFINSLVLLEQLIAVFGKEDRP